MEKELTELFMAINTFSDESEDLYMEIHYTANWKELEVCVRKKATYDYVEVRKIYLDKAKEKDFLELIKFVKEY